MNLLVHDYLTFSSRQLDWFWDNFLVTDMLSIPDSNSNTKEWENKELKLNKNYVKLKERGSFNIENICH